MITQSNNQVQSTFLEQVRKRVPVNLSFVDELAEILNISRDSVYRRMRGETVLSLDEVMKICQHFNVSLDTLLSPTSEMVSFHNRVIHPQHFTFEKWLQSILQNLEMIAGLPQREIFYCAKDVPFFHYFKFPRLAAFKMFFWMKSYHNYPEYANQRFNPLLISKELLTLGEKIWTKYTSIPSTEIWSEETCYITLKQIEFYLESGVLKSDQAIELCDLHNQLINSIREEAAKGNKGVPDVPFHIYKNEILIAETTLLFKMHNTRVAYITYNTMNVLTTSHEAFCLQIENYLENVKNKSSQISTTGEKERNKFFNKMEEQTLLLKDKISRLAQ